MQFETPVHKGLLMVIALMWLAACEHVAEQDTHEMAHADPEPVTAEANMPKRDWAVSAEAANDAQPRISQDQESATPRSRHRFVEIGTRPLSESQRSQNTAASGEDEGEITLNFQDTDIREFIQAVVGDVLNLNYVVDPQIGGHVSLQTGRAIKKEQLFAVLEEVLAMNGATLVETDGLYKIVPRSSAQRGSVYPQLRQQTKGHAVRIVPLDFIAAWEMQKILEPFLREGANLQIDADRNLLIMSGTPQELYALQETIDMFDVDWLRGMSVGLYPLDYVDPKNLKTELEAVLGAMQSGEGGALLQGLIRVVPLERLSSILLIGVTPAALREAELWVYRLDKPGETVGRRLYVHRLKNAKSTELADILSRAFGTSSSEREITSPLLAPGLDPVTLGRLPERTTEAEAFNRVPAPVATEQGITMSNGDAIEIIADDVRNALVILATPREYKMVKAAVDELDIVPLQVLIEASIIEVTLSDDLSYGLEWFFKNEIDGRQGLSALDLGAPGIGALAPAFSFTLVDNVGDVRLALNALAEKTNLNVLSSPSLMVLDNQTANINVGDEIPVPSRQSISNLDPNAPIVNEIQFRKTGVSLNVTPRVNASGLVTLEIKQEVSNAVATTSSSIDAPTIQQRMIESTVAVYNGDTIVLGGLIRDSQFRDNRGIPFLHQVPVLGKLFGATGQEALRTELLVLLTPRVVRNRDESQRITDEFRRSMRGLQPFDGKSLDTGS